MSTLDSAGTYTLGTRTVKRMGYGAMRLSGPGIFGPPKDRAEAVAVLRAAIDAGVDHIDTCDYYGPHVTNQIIREALHPYPASLTLVTKIGARRGSDGSWIRADSAAELESAVHDNLRNLELDVIEAVNFRAMLDPHGPAEGTIEPQLTTMFELQRKGLIRHVGVSNVTSAQVAKARALGPIACVQNHYNLAHRVDDALIDELANADIAYVPYFPLGGFSPLQSTQLSEVAARLQATPLQVALAWLLKRAPNVLLIPGTSSFAHLHENLDAASLRLPTDALEMLDGMAAR